MAGRNDTDLNATLEPPAAAAAPIPSLSPPTRARGRPALMNRDAVLDKIRQRARGDLGLFRMHHIHSDLYARARRQFGSWSRAVRAAGLDYQHVLSIARRRSIETRRQRRRRPAR